jgi:hypothetical protein
VAAGPACQRAVSPGFESRGSVLDQGRAVLFALSAIKLLSEIALLALLGQGVLYVLAGARRDTNFFYGMLKAITNPVTWVTRRITPHKVADQHVPFVAFFLLAIVWVVVTIEKIRHCVEVGMVGCR